MVEKTVQVAEGLGNADASQVLKGATFTSETGFNQTGTFEPTAANITYDNTNSRLAATDAQGAIDELNSNIVKKGDYNISMNFNGWEPMHMQTYTFNNLAFIMGTVNCTTTTTKEGYGILKGFPKPKTNIIVSLEPMSNVSYGVFAEIRTDGYMYVNRDVDQTGYYRFYLIYLI